MSNSGFISSDMPLVSVIVPIYNTEQFLSQCIDSILCQSYNRFELLLIDDGSTDRSGSICDDYSNLDDRVIVFHKKNAGVCSARNKGLEEAKGQFIVFVDADDYVSPLYIEHLMASEADLVITGLQKTCKKNETYAPTNHVSYGIEELPHHWNTKPAINLIYNFSITKRFRTRIIQEHKIRFEESLFFSEDMLFNMHYMCHSESFTDIPVIDYLYRIEDISRNKKFRMSADSLITHYEHINDGIRLLELATGDNSLNGVRDDINLRLFRKLYYYLLNCNYPAFRNNIKSFKRQDWANYMLGLLVGKKERRIMKNALRTPFLTYLIDIKLRKLLGR